MITRKDEYIYEELTLDEFSKKFANSPDYGESSITDLYGEGVQVCTLDESGNEVYKDILSFVVKPAAMYHYTDGLIKVTEDHTFVENGLEIKAQHHKDFVRVEEPIKVVDIEVEDLHTYLANGRLNHNTTSGGKALPFHASCRIRLKGLEKLKSKSGNIEQIIGVRTEAQVVKNRMGPPFKKANFDIYFDSGIDDVNSWLTLLKDYEVIKQSGSWYMITGPDGQELKFQAKDWRAMVSEDDDLREFCYNKICEVVIMKYRAEDINPDDILTEEDLPND